MGSVLGNGPQPPVALDEEYSSWLCGGVHEAQALRALSAQAHVTRCSWEGENCIDTRCCLDQFCPEDPQDEAGCGAYRCFQKNETWASCSRLCYPGDWTCKALGSVRRHLELGLGSSKARDASLFCVTAVAKAPYINSGQLVDERALLQMQQDHGTGVVGCDASMTTTVNGSHWSSYRNNVEAFVGLWDAVRIDGRYRDHSWTVKVDADAVFLPERLRVRLVKLAVPARAAAYVENSHAVKWQLAGALLVLTREALDQYFLDSKECLEHLPHQGREDLYMKLCLDTAGVQHTRDFGMLKDLREAPGPCTDPWAAAFHPVRTADRWAACLSEQQASHASALPEPPEPPAAAGAVAAPGEEELATESATREPSAAAPTAVGPEEEGYDCELGLAHWTKAWVVDKALWCCQHNGVGCIGNITASKPFDCEASREDFEREWTLAKALWCCKHEGVGCFNVSK